MISHTIHPDLPLINGPVALVESGRFELAPNVGPARGRTSRSLGHRAAGLPDGFYERHRGLVADGAVRSFFIVLSPISLAFRPRVVQRQEPVLVDAFGSDLVVERFHVGIVGRFAWPREVQRHAIAPSPQVEIFGDELRAIVEPDCLRCAVDRSHS